MIKSIAFSAYPIADMERSRQFYEGVLGLKPATNLGGYWQEYELGDGTFGIMVAGEDAPEFYRRKGASVAFEVEDIDAAAENVKAAGVPVIYGPAEFPTCRM